MRIKLSLLLLAVVVGLLAGCNKELKQATEKIAEQTQKLAALQEMQARQISMIQTQIVSLGPMLEEMNGVRYQKSYADALFFHTNTLYLLLAVDRQIESELKAAESRQQTQRDLLYSNHTNLLTALQVTAAEIRAALLAQQSRMETNIAVLGALMTQQVESLTPSAEELGRRQQMAADLQQIKAELNQIRTRLSATNAVTLKP